MSKSKPITYDGVEYPSLSALGRAYGIGVSMVKVRLKNGTPMDAPRISASEAGRRGRAASGWGSGNEILLGKSRR